MVNHKCRVILCTLLRRYINTQNGPVISTNKFSIQSLFLSRVYSCLFLRMDRPQLFQRLMALRQEMLNQGILDEYFHILEGLEESQPDFVEIIFGLYFKQSADYFGQLEKNLVATPMNMAEVERLTIKLIGNSSTIGAGRLADTVKDMLEVFKSNNFDGLGAAFERVKAERAVLLRHLEPYVELLRQLRGEGPPPADDDSDDDE